jgi:hypothetical protein
VLRNFRKRSEKEGKRKKALGFKFLLNKSSCADKLFTEEMTKESLYSVLMLVGAFPK